MTLACLRSAPPQTGDSPPSRLADRSDRALLAEAAQVLTALGHRLAGEVERPLVAEIMLLAAKLERRAAG